MKMKMKRSFVAAFAVTGAFGFLVSCSSKTVVDDPRDPLRKSIDAMVANYVEPEEEVLPEFASPFTQNAFQMIPWVAQSSKISSLHLVYTADKAQITMNLDRSARKITKYVSEPGVAVKEDSWQWVRYDQKQNFLRTVYAVMMEPALFPAKISVRTQNAYNYQNKKSQEEITEARLTVNDPAIGYDTPYACARYDVVMKELYGGGSAAVYVASSGHQNPVRIDFTDRENNKIRLEFSYADFHGISLPNMIAVTPFTEDKPGTRVVMTLKEQDIKLTNSLIPGGAVREETKAEEQKDAVVTEEKTPDAKEAEAAEAEAEAEEAASDGESADEAEEKKEEPETEAEETVKEEPKEDTAETKEDTEAEDEEAKAEPKAEDNAEAKEDVKEDQTEGEEPKEEAREDQTEAEEPKADKAEVTEEPKADKTEAEEPKAETGETVKEDKAEAKENAEAEEKKEEAKTGAKETVKEDQAEAKEASESRKNQSEGEEAKDANVKEAKSESTSLQTQLYLQMKPLLPH